MHFSIINITKILMMIGRTNSNKVDSIGTVIPTFQSCRGNAVYIIEFLSAIKNDII